MIDIYLLCFNEEKILQFAIDHYKKHFPNANIIFYDNMSTDRSEEIIKANNCQIRKFDTNNTFNDQVHMDLKNKAWKEQSVNDWVLTADLDELAFITEDELKKEASLGTSIISFEGYTIVGERVGFVLDALRKGIRDGGHDKRHIFNRRLITDMNYSPGAHTSNPKGVIKFSEKKYKVIHYKWLSLDYVSDRHSFYSKRMSDANKKNGWGIQYYWTQARLNEVYESLLPHLIDII